MAANSADQVPSGNESHLNEQNLAIPFTLRLRERKNGLIFKKAWPKRILFFPDKQLKDPLLEVKIDETTWLRYKLAVAAFQESLARKKYSLLWSKSDLPFVTVRSKNIPNDYLWHISRKNKSKLSIVRHLRPTHTLVVSASSKSHSRHHTVCLASRNAMPAGSYLLGQWIWHLVLD